MFSSDSSLGQSSSSFYPPIQFQGKTFQFGQDLSEPITILGEPTGENYMSNNFLAFLNKLRELGVLEHANTGTIVFADDQFVNLQAVKMAIQDLGISTQDRFKMFSNG